MYYVVKRESMGFGESSPGVEPDLEHAEATTAGVVPFKPVRHLYREEDADG